MATLEVDVNPAVLIWARTSIGLSPERAAEELNLFPGELQLFEEGHLNVPLPKLEKMAEVYDRPLLALLSQEPVDDEASLPDFRLLPGLRHEPWSPALHRAFRRSLGQREVLLELQELQETAPPTIDVSLTMADEPETAGERIRAWLDPENGRTAPGIATPGEVFTIWVSLIEDKGILVTQAAGIPLEEMRGFSIDDRPYPVIVVNGKDSPRGKTFTLIHELAHVLMGRGALCDLQDSSSASTSDVARVEWFCNQVAAAVLIPKEALLREDLVARSTLATRWTDADLRALSARFGVSAEAMLLRLVTLGKATREYYRERRPRFLAVYAQRRGQGSGHGHYYRDKVRYLGRRYIKTLLQAFDNEDLSLAELSTYLDVKYKDVPKLRDWLRRNE